MRIVLDLQSLQTTGSRNRGIGRYSMALAQAMISEGTRHEFLIMLNHAFPDTVEAVRQEFADLLPPESIVLFEIPTPVSDLNPDNRWRCRTAELIREHFLQQLRPDWVHVSSLFEGGDNSVTSIGRFARLPTAVTLYDLIPYLHPEHYLAHPMVRSWYMRKLAHLRNADLLLAISEHSRQEAIEALGLPADRVVNVSTDADARFRVIDMDRATVHSLRDRYGLRRDFVMYTGGIDYRKNMEGLIEAYACLPATVRMDHQLAIMGQAQEEERGRLLAVASRLGLSKDEVVLTGYVSDQDLVGLYNLCKLFVFPSLHEGFGLPALEAMRCGAPVIGSNRTSIPEVIGLEEALFDPASTRSICESLKRALTDDQFRYRLREHGRVQTQKFSWSASARRALEALEALHERRQRAQGARVQVPAGPSRPRLAYFSPLPPEKSGIADYSAELLPELARYYEIDLITDLAEISDPWLAANFQRRTVAEFQRRAHEYDRLLYHFGNSLYHRHMFALLARYPGTVVLHDFFLSGILSYFETTTPGSSVFRQVLYRSHGYPALRDWRLKGAEETMWIYPCCWEVLQGAQGVIVHSEHSLRLAEEFFSVRTDGHLVRIPSLRSVPRRPNRTASRKALGLPEDAFLVCSFGILGPTKLNHCLLKAWLDSDLARDEGCYLLFVGEEQRNPYEQSLRQQIRASGARSRVKIIGYVTSEAYQHYLAAVDVAVQLRTRSRGEMPRSVFDCLAHGVVTLVNSHGALAELPEDTAVRLPDVFSDAELTEVLERLYRDPARRQALGQAAIAYVRAHLDAAHIAQQYAEAIESFTVTHHLVARRRLLSAIAALPAKPIPGDGELARVAESVAENTLSSGRRQLLVDVSELARPGVRTGTEQVTRNILHQILMRDPGDYRVEPIYRSDDAYRYARRLMQGFLDVGELGLDDSTVEVAPGDAFLGLNPGLGIDEAVGDWLRHHARRGLRVYFVIYDLLPLLRREDFPPEARPTFARWFESIAVLTDGLVCTSRTLAAELGQCLEQHPVGRTRPLRIGFFHPGAERDAGLPANTSPQDSALLARVAGHTSILMVGLVEPGQGHSQALEAFEVLWAGGNDLLLVVAGIQGWMAEDLAQRLRDHPERGKRLLWLEHVTEDQLLKLYRTVTALLIASEGGGLALPLIEAARHDLPVIVRELPVSREIAGDHAFYFRDTDGRALADVLEAWLVLYRRGEHPRSGNMRWLTWEETRWIASWEPERGFHWHEEDDAFEKAPGHGPETPRARLDRLLPTRQPRTGGEDFTEATC